jgi:hypothetical protein
MSTDGRAKKFCLGVSTDRSVEFYPAAAAGCGNAATLRLSPFEQVHKGNF